MRRTLLTILSCVAIILGQTSLATAQDTMWEEGRHYKVLPLPVKTNDSSKIEVVEAFWYGCPHCYDFNRDYLPNWEKSLAEDVDFILLPATFSSWKIHAKAFYAAEFLGVLDKLHQPLFDAIKPSPRDFKEVEDFKPIFLSNGVKEEDFDNIFKASGFRKISKVDEALLKAEERIKAYRITGVPALIVNGKYKIGVRDAGNFANMIKIANYLIAKERDSMKK